MNMPGITPLLLLLICSLQIPLHNDATPLLLEKIETERQFEFTFRNMKRAYKMAVPRENPCPKGTKMFISVLSRRNGTAKREAIRATWAADKLPNQVLRFVIGQAPKANETEDAALRKEQFKFRDLLFYGMPDGYYNLPLKLMAIFQWQQAFCGSAKFLLKIDDDLVADLERLDFWIGRRYEPILERYPRSIFGQMIVFWERGGIAHHSTVVRKNSEKWYMPAEDYPSSTYPPYLNGPAYLMSTKAVEAILSHTVEVPFLRFEDLLFTGILGERANVSLFGYESTFQIVCQESLPCNTSHPIGDTYYPKMESNTLPNGTLQFLPEPEEGIQFPKAKGQRHCEPLTCDQKEDIGRLNLILSAPDGGIKEEQCEIGLNGNCGSGMPKVAIWCRSAMKKLEDYAKFYARLRELRCG